jgi:predicted nucleotidyltransferase component of viral defense system
MKGLSVQSENILTSIAECDFINDYTFIGGSSLAVQIGHRLSEDLDFYKWKTEKEKKPTVNWPEIEKHLEPFGIADKNILGFDQIDFFIENGVKVSFYANQRRKSPVMETVSILGKINAPNIETIGVMKLELMLRRSNFRDYYDIYSILREGASLKQMVYGAGRYTGYSLKSKDILAFISNGENYGMEKNFERLMPRYSVNETDIENFIKECIERDFGRNQGRTQ